MVLFASGGSPGALRVPQRGKRQGARHTGEGKAPPGPSTAKNSLHLRPAVHFFLINIPSIFLYQPFPAVLSGTEDNNTTIFPYLASVKGIAGYAPKGRDFFLFPIIRKPSSQIGFQSSRRGRTTTIQQFVCPHVSRYAITGQIVVLLSSVPGKKA